MAGRDTRRRFGQVNRLRSGRWQARFTVPAGHPSGRGGHVVTAARTFEPNSYGRQAAGDWLRTEELRLHAEGASWRTIAEHAADERRRAAAQRIPTFAEYAEVWLRARKVKGGRPLEESTKRGYLTWLRRYLLPTFGPMPLDTITAADVLDWYDALPHDKAKTVRECYALASERRRKRVRTVPITEAAALASTESPGGAGDELWPVLAVLPRQQRAVLVLRYDQDLPDAEIAN